MLICSEVSLGQFVSRFNRAAIDTRAQLCGSKTKVRRLLQYFAIASTMMEELNTRPLLSTSSFLKNSLICSRDSPLFLANTSHNSGLVILGCVKETLRILNDFTHSQSASELFVLSSGSLSSSVSVSLFSYAIIFNDVNRSLRRCNGKCRVLLACGFDEKRRSRMLRFGH